jgi:hypothetical protein
VGHPADNQAARQDARVAHFPEGALSGYAGTHFAAFTGFDWTRLSTRPSAFGNGQASVASGWSPGPRTASARSAPRTTAVRDQRQRRSRRTV